MREKNRAGIVIAVLILVILVLLIFITYIFFVKPAINKYILQKQTEANQELVQFILYQVQQKGSVQISDGENTLVLVPYQA